MSTPPKPATVQVAIKKGTDPDKLSPLTLIKISEDGTLKQLRDTLKKAGYMKNSDLFFSLGSFPIHKEDEGDYQWKDALWPPNSDNSKGEEPKEKPEASSNDSGGAAPKPKDTVTTISSSANPYIAIQSTTKKLNEFNAAELPNAHTFTPITDPKVPNLPDSKPTVASPNFANPSQPVENVLTLDNSSLAQLFEINGLFCGSSVLNHPSTRVCARIFQSPPSLIDFVQVSDATNIETRTTDKASQSDNFKYGFAEAELHVNTPWVKVSASYSQSNATGHKEEKDQSYETAIYRYSRAVVRLPLDKLEPTEEFKADLAAALKAGAIRNVVDLFETYGHVIATEIHLGAHLHMTRTYKKNDKGDSSKKEQSARASLSTIVNIGGSGQWGSKDDHDSSSAQSAGNLGIEAIGGNTVLASNLALWPLSVLPHQNWRVTKLAKLKLLTDCPKLFTAEQKKQLDSLLKRDDSNETPIQPHRP